ncbi:MAG TPA: glycosyltransferase, partial [Chitinophagaceae bacterium]|nr:glycosyltransferase [Chitinophagaceae bacterium]
MLAKKIQQLAMSFLSYPTIYIACKSKEQHDAIKKTIQEHYADININITICDNFIPVLNKIIADTTCTKIVIDNLNLSYSFFQILSPFKNQEPPVFNYGSVLADKIINISSGKLLLVDILTTRILLDNLAFEKSTWIKINGFDPSIADEVMIWDFCIRALIPANSYALESPAALVSQKKNENQIIDDSNYSAVIEKHKNLYGANLNQVLKLVSENQYIPQNEIFNLNSKITSLDVFLKHSKDEVKSLNEFSSSLQNRIRTLESSRFYKWSERIKHYKKIFFKEKKPGRGILKSIIKFILFIFSKAGFGIFRTVLKRIFLKLYSITEPKPFKIIYLETNNAKTSLGAKYFLSYNDWITSKLEYDVIKKEYDSYADLMMLKPKISVIMPVYNPSVNFLKEAIDSVINQLYDNWELCIADDCSPNPQIKRLLNSYSLRDERIKVNFRTENGHISACSNSALELTTGDYIMLMDHDDLLTQNCMFEFVKHLNTFPNHQLIYSDEDKVQDGVFSDPFFKPDYSPDKLLATNYISHVVLIDKKIMDKVQGFHLGFEGSQDFDLMLRCAEQTDKIGHISKILYHWRIHEMSVAGGAEAKPYAYIAAKKAISEALIRRHTPGEVSFQLSRGYYRIAYDVKHYSKVSIIIPTKDAFKLTKNTIDSILKFTEYPNYEIIVLNNNSVSKDFYALMDKYKAEYSDKFMCVDANFPFNFSKLINLGVSKSTGKYILMLNNDVEIIQKDWLTTMVSYSQHKTTGAVGVKLLYPDDRIQHAGVIIGLGNIRIAGHPFVNHYKDDHGYFNYIQTTDNYSAVTAACLMCRKEIFEEVGGMDETLEVEYNDIDFCLKLVDRGYYNVYLPEVTLYHYESSTRDHPFQNKVAYQRHLK